MISPDDTGAVNEGGMSTEQTGIDRVRNLVSEPGFWALGGLAFLVLAGVNFTTGGSEYLYHLVSALLYTLMSIDLVRRRRDRQTSPSD
jgi:hypothetical protein